MYENSVTYQFVANVANTLANGASVIGLPEGALCVVDAAHNAIVGVPAGVNTPVKIAHRINGVLKFSPEFTRNTLNINQRLAYVAPVEQVSFIGYNGTAGAMDADANTTYTLSINLTNTAGIYNNGAMIKTVPVFLPNDAALQGTALGQLTLASELVKSLIRQFQRFPGPVITADRLSSHAVVAFPAGVINVTNGSATVVGVNAALANVAANGVGSVVRFANINYRVASVAVGALNTTLVLDTPFTGATAALNNPANSGSATLAIATGVGVLWGVRLTGRTSAAFDAVTMDWPNHIVRFDLGFSKNITLANGQKVISACSAPVATTGAHDGQGTAAEVAYREIYTSMNEGNTIVSAFPPTRRRNSVNLAGTYNQQVLAGVHDKFVDVATGLKPVSKFNINVAVNTALAADWADLNVVLP